MAEDDRTYYGLDAWRWWQEEAPPDLRDTKYPAGVVARTDPCEVTSYRELVKLAAFLNVMNKRDHLLYRGQSGDWALRPTLLRETWTLPRTGEAVDLGADRRWYFDQLDHICRRVAELLAGRLPRHKPFETFGDEPARKMAPWSVIQHYELWPTPVLDFTGSLRIAASFALGGEEPRSSGYVYVSAFRSLESDPMLLHERGRGPVALRLSAVCPPIADRPHLQEGFLVGNPAFGATDLTAPPATGVLVARIHVVDRSPGEHGPESFWDEEYPRHSQESLLPQADETLRLFDEALEHRVRDGRVSLVPR